MVKVASRLRSSLRRRQGAAIDFNPNGTPPDVYNLYRGFLVKPVEGDCGLFIEHIEKIIASDDPPAAKYILDLFADAVQNPGKKPGVALVLRGEQGVGKGIFVQYFGKLFESHFAQVTNPKHLFGGFNARLEDKMILYADEAFFAGNKEHEGILKGLVTEYIINIERKGKDVVRRKNFIRLIMASNSDWVVPAMGTERRFCEVDVSDAQRGNHAYFEAISKQMDNGGLEAFMYMLQHRDITNVNLRDFPHTEALKDQKIHSMTPFESWLYDSLMQGGFKTTDTLNGNRLIEWGNPVTIDTLLDSLALASKQRNLKAHISATQMGRLIRKYLPYVEKTRLSVSEEGEKLERKGHILVPSLDESRKFFDNKMGFKSDWPETQ